MRHPALLLMVLAATSLTAQTPAAPDWAKAEAETMQHFQTLLRFDTSDPPMTPPGGEKPAADYIKQVLDKEGIPAELFALDANRPNVVARLKGNGSKRPLLLMAHTDVVNVDPRSGRTRRSAPTRRRVRLRPRGGGRQGQRDRGPDDAAHAQAPERAARSRCHRALRVGRRRRRAVRHSVHGGEPLRHHRVRVLHRGGRRRHAAERAGQVCVGPDPREDSPRHPAHRQGRGRPRVRAARVELDRPALGCGGQGRQMGAADSAQRDDRHLLQAPGHDLHAGGGAALPRRPQPRPKVASAADAYLRKNEPRHASMLRTSLSPNIFAAGYRVNVIPSEATATIDVRHAAR
jgi:acetylornithine deacetylase/succinyl-diaminopimelate desuccinylase-like protein